MRPSAEGYPDLALALDLRGALLVAEATVRGPWPARRAGGPTSAPTTPSSPPPSSQPPDPYWTPTACLTTATRPGAADSSRAPSAGPTAIKKSSVAGRLLE